MTDHPHYGPEYVEKLRDAHETLQDLRDLLDDLKEMERRSQMARYWKSWEVVLREPQNRMRRRTGDVGGADAVAALTELADD